MKSHAHKFNFTKTLLGLLLLFGVALGLIWYTFFNPSMEDEREYRALVLQSNPTNSNIPASPYKATQHRNKIQKDLLFAQGNERLHLRLNSAEADMTVDHRNNSTDLIEKMRGVTCLMQEELFYRLPDGREAILQSNGQLLVRAEGENNSSVWIDLSDSNPQPMQRIRYLEAEEATYSYKTSRLLADRVKIYRYILPGHVLPNSLSGEIPQLKGYAKAVEFSMDDKQMRLTGDVVMDNEQGTLFADEIIMKPLSEGKKVRLGVLEMNRNVKLALKDGGELNCARALLDYQALVGNFFGDTNQEFVVYRENCRDKNQTGRQLPLVIKSRKMTFVLNKARQISNIVAENQVTVDYDHNFIAAADYATYQRSPLEGISAANISMPGQIILKPNEINGICKITNQNGDIMTAHQIDIDTIQQQVCFSYPKGELYTSRPDRSAEKIDFSSDIMVMDKKNNKMTLREHVVIHQKGLGQLTSEKEVTFFQRLIGGKNQISSIESLGKTILTRVDLNKNFTYTITSHGKLIVDHPNLLITMVSPRDSHGMIMEGQQVFFQDPMGEIYADQANIQYNWADKALIPGKMTLSGHVRFLDSSSAQNGIHSPLSKYALSDKLEYFPDLQEAIFTADKGSRVLFYSKANDLQVSAPALKIRRDEITKKESIKGIGDVRFSFIEHEFEQLKQRFSLSQSLKKQDP